MAAPRLLALLLVTFAGQSVRSAESDRPLFNGVDLAGWSLVAEPGVESAAVCRVLPDGVLAVAGTPTSFLATTASYENYRLHVEWRWPDKTGNGGILLHIASGPKDRQWPLSIQVQTKHGSAGDILPMAGATFAEPLDPKSPRTPQRLHLAAASERPPGEWNSADIVCRGDTVEVSINGVAQNAVTRISPAKGQIGFQLEGTPFELRRVVLTPLP